MKLNLSKINLSRNDLKRNLKFPRLINEKLAEDIGIMIGDGHISKKIRLKKAVDYPIYISGNAVTDRDYVINHIKKLKKELFNLNFPIFFRRKNEICTKLNSKGLVEFYTKIIGLPLGKKTNIKIPLIIWHDLKLIKACLRGIVDTDFSFVIRKNNYPHLKLKTQSRNLVEDCKKAFKLIGIETSIKLDVEEYNPRTRKTYITNYLYLSGHKKVMKFIKEINFSNQRNLIKAKKYIWARRDLNPGPSG